MRMAMAGMGLGLCSGCASEQQVSVVGEAGLVAWSTSVYFTGSPATEWASANFVTDQPYVFQAELTEAGSSVLLAPERIAHHVGVSEDLRLETFEVLDTVSMSGIADFRAVPTTPETFYIIAFVDGEVVDATTFSVRSGRVQVDDGMVYGEPSFRW